MKINEISRFDAVNATVVNTTKEHGVYLTIDELEDNPTVKLYDVGTVNPGDKLLVSISKISEDLKFIKVKLDAFIQTKEAGYAA